MNIKGSMIRYEDFKYVMQDVSNLYLGAKFTYEELMEHERVPFKLKAILTNYILKEAAPDTTLESQFYYLEENTFLYEVFKQLKIRVKLQMQIEKKSLFGGRKTGYQEKIFPLQEFVSMNLAKKKGAGVLISEIIISKLGMMAFTI